MQAEPATPKAFVDALLDAVGADSVITDDAEREFFSQDVFRKGATVAAIVRPTDVDTLQAALRIAAQFAVPVIPRGGGMSYTDGFLAQDDTALLVDTGALDRIVEINTEDMYVTVEAGCTWRALAAALEPHGVRTPYWGPLSGLRATVGGALSQGSVFLGSGQHGSAADNVQSLDVLLADGSLVTTGSAANQHASPFYRHLGPDLTGLFTGDCGALGIKVRATLPLKRLLPETRHASFGFKTFDAMMRAMCEIAREDLVSECFAFDPGLQGIRLKRSSMTEDVKSLGRVIKGAGSLAKGLKAGAKIVAAGRSFLKDLDFSMHVTLDARTAEAAEEKLAAVRRICADGGSEVEATMPRVMRADPFANVNSLLGPGGERWAPVHGIFAMSRAADAFRAVEAVFERHSDALESMDIDTGVLMCAIATSAILVEPCLYWPDEQMTIHKRFLDPQYRAKLTDFPANETARARVAQIRDELTTALHECGATHFQLGKYYPYLDGMNATTRAAVEGIKAAVDPDGRMNPGALGLASRHRS